MPTFRTTLRLAPLALLMVVGACSDDPGPGDDATCSGAFCIEDAPQLELTPNERRLEIIDVAMDPGETVTRTFRVINVGTGDLRLRDVSVNYAAPASASDSSPPFRILPLPAALPFAIKPFGGVDFPQGFEITVEYTKQDDDIPREAEVVLVSNDIRNPTQTVTLTTDAGVPRIATRPARMDFGLIPRSDTPVVEKLTLLNTGTRPLRVSGFRVARDGRFGVRGPGFATSGPDALRGIDLAQAITVGPGEAWEGLEVTFLSDSAAPAEADLIIYSDDPLLELTGHAVPLVANKSGPCMLVEPGRVDFGGKRVGTVSRLDVTVTSCGNEPLEISSISLSPESSLDFELDLDALPAGFEAGPTPQQPLSVPVNGSVTFSAIYVPDAVNPRDAANVPIPDEGDIIIGSNAFEAEYAVPVSGAGADTECPTPVIRVAEGEEVIPQTVLSLDGRGSYAPFGSIVNWNWSVTAWPVLTPRPTLIPGFTDPAPMVEVNSVGLYTFKLSVRDEFGNSSGAGLCPDAEFTVLVQPDQAIHVELTWTTPDPRATTEDGEGRGTDLDLHFAHDFAVGPDLDDDGSPDPWFDRTWDVFWYNVNPNWASFDPNVRDDPSLDRDDIDGGGPENLNLAIPEDGVSYRIGVHAWSDWGFGPSDATVRVFHYAEQVYEATLPGMAVLDMWCVGTITWPVPSMTRCASDGEPERVSPRYVNPFFQPPVGP